MTPPMESAEAAARLLLYYAEDLAAARYPNQRQPRMLVSDLANLCNYSDELMDAAWAVARTTWAAEDGHGGFYIGYSPISPLYRSMV